MTLHVRVATPLGRGGMGGIDRMMDALADELSLHPIEGVSIEFTVTRGQGSMGLAGFVLIGFLIAMLRKRIIRQCDLVHINLSADGSTWRKMIVGIACRALRVPYVLHLHAGRYETFYSALQGSARRRTEALFRHSVAVVVLGQVWRNFLLRNALVDHGRIVILPNATQVRARQRSRSEDATILFLGRLGENKGVPQLVEALGRLSDVPGWCAILAGDGTVEEFRARAAPLGDRVQFPGWLGPAETDDLLASADILVLPSFAENLPMSVVEGMAAGLAVVATPVGAVPEIIRDDATGLLVPAGDVDALTAALRRLIEDAALRERLGGAARQFHKEHLNIETYARRLADVWRTAAGSS